MVEKESKTSAVSSAIQGSKQFFVDVNSELRKVSWPSRQETINSTVVVIGLIFILAIFLGIVDGVLAKVIGLVIQ